MHRDSPGFCAQIEWLNEQTQIHPWPQQSILSQAQNWSRKKKGAEGWISQGKTENERIEKKEEMMLKLKMKETMRPKKFGKPTTTRSEKPKIKRTVKKKVVDEETKDQQDYLGVELKVLEE